ncbi:MAG: S41 family peptidase [bacterium]|nr:S41 family peptidase [bacterium]
MALISNKNNQNGSSSIFGTFTPTRLLLTLVLTLMVFSSVAQAADDPAARRREFYENLKILGEAYERIINNYVDEKDPKEIMEAGVKGMLDTLDEHSNYLPPVNYEDLMTSTEGEFGGLGITINIRDHFPTVVSPIEGTPAYYMGIQGGDQIVEIEGESTRDFTSRDAVKKLRGPKGTQVNITIARPGSDDPLPMTITRDIIKVESVPYGFMMGDIGYVKVQNFAKSTHMELEEKLKDLTDQGMKGLILDLRFNPGGLLYAAQEVSSLFLEDEQLVVFTKGRLREQNKSYYAGTRGPIYNKVPVVVLVNGSSASASEIVSAAIQDHDSGLVVGKTSFGKGSVQTVFRLDEDEALKLTTARYYTPSGRSIHKDRARHGEEEPEAMETVDLENDPAEEETDRFDKEKFYTDSGRVVYGGGGVTPDIEIEQDFMSEFEMSVERDGALFSFAVEYANEHQELGSDFEVDDETFARFSSFLEGREKIEEYLGVFELTYSDSLVDANSDYLKRGIRREIVRRTDGAEAAYRVAIEVDTQLEEALQLFEESGTLEELLEAAAEWNEEQMKVLASEEKPEEETVSN